MRLGEGREWMSRTGKSEYRVDGTEHCRGKNKLGWRRSGSVGLARALKRGLAEKLAFEQRLGGRKPSSYLGEEGSKQRGQLGRRPRSRQLVWPEQEVGGGKSHSKT